MNRAYILLLFISISVNMSAQQLLAEQNTKLVYTDTYPLLSFPVIDHRRSDLYIITHDRSGLNGYAFSSGKGFSSEIVSNHPRDRFAHYMGSTVKDSVVWLYLGDEFSRKIMVRTFDFNSGSYSDTVIKPYPANEAYVFSVEINDRNYIITVVKSSSVVGVYCLEGGKLISSNNIDFSEVSFNGYSLYDALNSPFADGLFYPSVGSFINPAMSFHDFNAINKLFFWNGQIFLTINNDNACTHLISINTADLSGLYTRIEVPQAGFTDGRSNSFLHKGILYQVYVSKNGLNLSGYNLTNKQIIKEYKYSLSDGEIFFANNPLTGYVISGDKKQLRMSDFLKRASRRIPGMVVRNDNENISIITGIKKGRTVYAFGSLFNPSTLEHAEGNLSPEIMTRINDFLKSGKIKALGITLFEFKGKPVLGYYDYKENKYSLFQF